ncbi:MAG: Uma2 family endonuclease [Acidimicrobiales bacterium]
MRAVMLDVPEHLLAERHRLGLDTADEMWEGELHMVPTAKDEHYRIEVELVVLLMPLAKARGLHVRNEAGLYDPTVPDNTSYRVPDLMVFGDEARSERGAEGRARLVVEIRSPGDESFQKIPFYGRMGVAEMLIIDRDTKEVRRWVGDDGELIEHLVPLGEWHALDALPVSLRGKAGRLQVRVGEHITEI